MPWWGQAEGDDSINPLYHYARFGSGTPSLCRKASRVVTANHPVTGALCIHCLDQLRTRRVVLGREHAITAHALASFVRTMLPFTRMLNAEIASLVALFCASYFDRGYAHPLHQQFVDEVYDSVLAYLGGFDGEPRLTNAERLWRIKQGVKRRSPRVDFVSWADRWRAHRAAKAREEHEAAIRVSCEHCGALPDDCSCKEPVEELIEPIRRFGT